MTDFVGTGTIVLFYGHVASNIGDLAINRGEVALLRHAFPHATIRAVLMNARRSSYLSRSKTSFGPKGSVEFSYFRTYDQRAPSYVLDPGQFLDDSGAGEADLVVLAAGEHLFQYADHQNDKNLFWRTLPAFAARQRGLPCLLMPSTFGPFESTEATKLIRRLFETGLRGAARDVRSLALVAAAMPSVALKTALDPAFFIPPPESPETAGERPAGERVIGLAMRSEGWGLRLPKEKRESATASFERDGHSDSIAFQFGVALAERILASGSRLRVFIQTEADRALSEAILAHYGETDEHTQIEIVTPKSIEEYLEAFAAVDGVVASRFHALILALVVNRPCFGVYFEVHGHKIPGLFELLERPDLCANLARTAPATAAEAAVRSLVAAVGSHSILRTRIETLRQQTLNWLTADWEAEATAARDPQTLEDLRPLSAVAIPLMDEAERKARAQRNRLAKVETTLKSLDKRLAAVTVELRSTEENLQASERLYDENKLIAVEMAGRLREVETAFEKQVTRLKDEVLAARVTIATTERDLAISRSKERRERRLAIERAEQAAKVRDELVKRVAALEQSESFRIGYAIVRVATVPVRLFRKLRALVLPQPPVPDNQPKGNDEPEEIEEPAPAEFLPTEELVSLYSAGGVDAVFSAMSDRLDADPAKLGTELIQASRQMAESGNRAAEYALVAKALHLQRSHQTLRAMFWTAQRAGKVREAWNCLTEIEELYGRDPSPGHARWLKKARAGAIMNLALLDEIVLAPSMAFEPRSGHICYVLHNSLPWSSGGYATRAHGLACGLRTVGVEATCITRPGYPFDVKPELKGTTLPPQHVIDDISYVHIWEPKRGGSALSRYVRGAANEFEAQFRKFRPELVIAASAYLSALPALIAAKRLGLPFIYEVRGFWEITRLSRQPDYAEKPFFHVQKQMEAEIAGHSDHVFTLTAPMRDELVERGVPLKQISLLPNSCDPDRFTPRPRDAALSAKLGIPAEVPVIGYIGTFVQYEGLEDLARACVLLRTRGVFFRLMLVGNEDTSNSGRGRITGDIEQIANEGGLADWLIMPGRVPHDEVESYYSLIDIAPFPRKPQPVTEMVSPMKPLEALSMEKAVVVSSVRALAEIVSDGETGLVFEKGNIESMADTLARLIVDPDLRAQLGRTARTWVERERTWIATAAKARDEIKRIVSAHNVPRQAATPRPEPTATAFPARSQPPATPHDRGEIFDAVRKLYTTRDRARRKIRFPADDWERTRLAFEMIEGARTIVDIGIGQAQLVNLLARCPNVQKIHGFDFRNYTTRIDPPANGRYDFRVWDVTGPLKNPPNPVDVVVAMEVLEHIEVPVMPEVFQRLRAMSSQGATLITVPYREKEPLYHHDQRHGHKQSFDDAKIKDLFGPGCLYTNYKEKWYFVFVHNDLAQSESLDLLAFCERVQQMMHQPEIDLATRQAAPAIH